MIIYERQGFRLNTDLFETNILNLTVVLGVVITVVGDSIRTILDQRRKVILSTLSEADQKVREKEKALETAKIDVDKARLRCQEILIGANNIVEQESSKLQEQIKADLKRLRERGAQSIQLERQRIVQAISKQVIDLALRATEDSLMKRFKFQTLASSKQEELNKVHLNETFTRVRN
jgi:F-type H+-transporting ATPase subunit b